MDPFRIDVPDDDLADLRRRLGATRWPDPLVNEGWDLGVDPAYLRGLVEHWRTEYDWRAHEATLNAFPQFTTTIDDANVHLLHVRSPEPAALPLLLTHGWPGSVVEFLELIGPLTDPGRHGGDPRDAFHVVCPSMPGYGFSGPTADPGWDVGRMARAYAGLMDRLGYAPYGIHGGDWGSRICRDLALHDTANVLGMHVTMLSSNPSNDPADLEGLSDTDRERLDARKRFQGQMSGYLMIQASRPHTLGYALTDSPVGQLAWIVDLFAQFTDNDGTPDDAVDRDQLLTNVMLYWLTRTAGSAARLYLETARSGAWDSNERIEVPTGVAVFPREIAPPIRRFAERGHDIVHWTEHTRGGHFAAMEEPVLLVDDLRTFFRRFR